ncbi:hypothetical protein CHISP_0912 [Chitinispirillum alkaliphilum]|nr:hypothetical protein CHISP_0912 [Chitinispirillum alkaliphilum]
MKWCERFVFLISMLLLSTIPALSSEEEEVSYRIEQPGVITFTVGLQIEGRVDKPQVMIFLPKERPVFRNIELKKSFEPQIMQPFSHNPRLNITDH